MRVRTGLYSACCLLLSLQIHLTSSLLPLEAVTRCEGFVCQRTLVEFSHKKTRTDGPFHSRIPDRTVNLLLMRLRGGLPSCGESDPNAQANLQSNNLEERVTKYGPHRGGMIGCWTGIRRGDVVALDAKCKTKAEKALLSAYLPDALFFRHHRDWFFTGMACGFALMCVPLLMEHKYTAIQLLRFVWR
jgi:hypothetical protein